MPYTLQEVDDAEALVREIRPATLISRDDYDWALAIKDKDSQSAIILFRPQRGEQSEICSTPEEIESICHFLGSQWTAEEVTRIAAAARKHAALKINRIQ
jgi:hypothetical protein